MQKNAINFAIRGILFITINHNAVKANNSRIFCIYRAINARNFSLFSLITFIRIFCIHRFMQEIFSLIEKFEKCDMPEMKNAKMQEILRYKKSYLSQLIAMTEKCKKCEKSKKFEKCDNYHTCLCNKPQTPGPNHNKTKFQKKLCLPTRKYFFVIEGTTILPNTSKKFVSFESKNITSVTKQKLFLGPLTEFFCNLMLVGLSPRA